MSQPIATARPRWKPSGRAILAISISIALGVVVAGVLIGSRIRWERRKHAVRLEIAARQFLPAKPDLLQWLAREPDSAEAHALAARLYLSEARPKEALEELNRARDLGFPPEPLAVLRAIMEAKADRFDSAEPILARALAESNQPQPEVAEALARVYLATFRRAEAGKALERWMRDAPDDPKPYLWRNEIDLRRDVDPSVPIQNYREALRRDPNLPPARLGLADRLRQAHLLDEAAEEFARYEALKPEDPEGSLGAGRVALEQGHLDRAAQSFDRVLGLNPRESLALKERGAIDLKHGKYASARDFFRRAIAVDPFDPDAHYNLARALVGLNRADEAKIEDAIAVRLRDEHTRMADLKSALARNPTDFDLRFQVAQWLLDHGHDSEGLDWTRLLLHDRPGHRPTILSLIAHFERTKNPGQANYYRMLLKQSQAREGEKRPASP